MQDGLVRANKNRVRLCSFEGYCGPQTREVYAIRNHPTRMFGAMQGTVENCFDAACGKGASIVEPWTS